MVGLLAAPTDPARSWWWQSTTMVDGVETTIAGFAPTENDAILQAADPRYHEPGWWPGLEDKEP